MSKLAFYFLAALSLNIGKIVAQSQPLPELADARVTISYAELKSLWQAAQPSQQPPKPQPPVAIALSTAHYQVAWQPESAEVLAEFDVQNFTDDWNVLPLLGAEVQIASVEPADAQIISRDGHYAFVSNVPGKTRLKVHFAVKINGSDDAERLHFAIAPAFINLLTIDGLPESRRAEVSGATPVPSEHGSATFRLAARDQLDIEVATAKPVQPVVPSQWKLESQAFVRSEEGRLIYQTRLVLRTDAGSGLDADLQLPAGANISKVAGEDLAKWQARTAEDRSRTVQVHWETRDVLNRHLEIEYELPEPPTPGPWKLTAPQVAGGENTDALYVLAGEDGIELTPSSGEPVSTRLPRWLAEIAGAKKFTVVGRDGALQSKWLPLLATNPATIDSAKASMRVVADGSLLNEMVYTIRSDAPLAWPLQLPPGSELLSCSVDGRQASPISRGEGLIELPLNAANRISSEVRLSYTGRKPAFDPVSGQITVELPQTTLLIRLLEWELRIPAAYEVAALEGNVESIGGDSERDSRVIRLRKELCKAETPKAELFYQKPDTQN